MQTQAIIETIQNIFIGADERNWELCLSAMADTVLLDYASLSGIAPASVLAVDIIEGWKAFMPKFKATHHQLGNFTVDDKGDTASVFFYGTATHYLPNDSGNNIWTVVGTYNAALVRTDHDWKVTALKLNLKYVDGNTELPQLAAQS